MGSIFKPALAMAHNGTSQQGSNKHVPSYYVLYTRNPQTVDEMTSLPQSLQLEDNALPTIHIHMTNAHLKK